MHCEFTDVTGTKWVSDATDEELTDGNREALHDLLRDFSELNHLSLEIGGSKHYFNPAHIVSVAIVEEN